MKVLLSRDPHVLNISYIVTFLLLQKNELGEYPYKGTTDVLVKVVRGEGVLALWKGFTPYFLRYFLCCAFPSIYFAA